MYELSACIEWLFAEEEDFVRRIELAAQSGVECVEFWGQRPDEMSEISEALKSTGVRLSAFWSAPQARLVDPAEHDAFVTGVAESAAMAQTLNCRGLVVLAGDAIAGVSQREQADAVAEALRRAAPIAAQHEVTLLLEPINTRLENPAYFLDKTEVGLDIIESVASPNVKLLYDHYHALIMGEQPQAVLDGRMSLVGHVHLADVPDRHQPGTGTIDWPATLAWLKRSGYSGPLGLEYLPAGDTAASLSYLRSLL
jgi:hydroxypyruvate isomerase